MPLINRLIIDVQKLKEYLKIEYSEDDSLLFDLSKIAVEQISLFLNNDFEELNELGELVEKPIPLSLKIAVYQMVGSWYETRTIGAISKSVSGMARELGQPPIETIRLLSPYRRLVGL
jgi:Phage gp6-like head-tail connector protein